MNCRTVQFRSFQVPVALKEGLVEGEAVLLQSFLGLAAAAGSISYGCIVLSRSEQCRISRHYLLQSSIFGLGQLILNKHSESIYFSLPNT